MQKLQVIASIIHGVVKLYTMSEISTIPAKQKVVKKEREPKQENGCPNTSLHQNNGDQQGDEESNKMEKNKSEQNNQEKMFRLEQAKH